MFAACGSVNRNRPGEISGTPPGTVKPVPGRFDPFPAAGFRDNPPLTPLSPIDYTGRVPEKEIRKLELQNGLVPFDEWFDSLRDRRMQAAVDARLVRVRAGNFGDCKSVGGGVFELRIALGPGLRVYYGLHGRQVVVLLGGGDKRRQPRDIRRAQQLWQQFTKHAPEKLPD